MTIQPGASPKRHQRGFLDSKSYILLALSLFHLMALMTQAIINSPTSDEVAHLAASIATVRTGDPGFYRVNPPLPRWITGLLVDGLTAPKIQPPKLPSRLRSGIRYEFRDAKAYSVLNNGPVGLLPARIIRVTVVTLCGLWLALTLSATNPVAAVIFHSIWCTHPLILGHGWLCMVDSLAICSVAIILVQMIRWPENPLLMGLGWGLAISIKFTFLPLAAGWWAIWTVHHFSGRRILAAAVAAGVTWFVCCYSYGFAGIFKPVASLPLMSESLKFFDGWRIPSLLPAQLIVGIDEQLLDVEQGYPTYVAGTWYPDGVWWYYLFGLLAKTQVGLVVVAVVVAPSAVWGAVTNGQSGADSGRMHYALLFCVYLTFSLLLILSLNSRMALNVRYASPIIPAASLLLGVGVSLIKWPSWLGGKKVSVGFAALMLVESLISWPYYFSYNSFLFGGSYAHPPVLHDSNLDGGQHLGIAIAAAKRYRQEGYKTILLIDTREPSRTLDLGQSAVKPQWVEQFRRHHGQATDRSTPTLVIVSKSLVAPSPWATVNGKSNSVLLKEASLLAARTPDWQLTPVLMVYAAHMSLNAETSSTTIVLEDETMTPARD